MTLEFSGVFKVLCWQDGGGGDEKWVRSDSVSGLLKIWGQ